MDFSKYRINKDIPIPLYYQFKQIILDELNSNDVKPDDILPPEEVFCELFCLSRTTVRKAILELVNEGYLYRIKSKGTFVSKPKIKSSLLDMYDGYNIEIEGMNMVPSMKVIKKQVIIANKMLAKHLQIKEADEVLYVLRYRYADNQVMAHIESYLKYPLCEFVDEDKLHSSSMYDILAKNEYTRIRKIRRTIETCYANQNERKIMKMDKGGLINLCTNLGFSSSAEPIIYEIVKYRGDKIKYTIDIDID